MLITSFGFLALYLPSASFVRWVVKSAPDFVAIGGGNCSIHWRYRGIIRSELISRDHFLRLYPGRGIKRQLIESRRLTISSLLFKLPFTTNLSRYCCIDKLRVLFQSLYDIRLDLFEILTLVPICALYEAFDIGLVYQTNPA